MVKRGNFRVGPELKSLTIGREREGNKFFILLSLGEREGRVKRHCSYSLTPVLCILQPLCRCVITVLYEGAGLTRESGSVASSGANRTKPYLGPLCRTRILTVNLRFPIIVLRAAVTTWLTSVLPRDGRWSRDREIGVTCARVPG